MSVARSFFRFIRWTFSLLWKMFQRTMRFSSRASVYLWKKRVPQYAVLAALVLLCLDIGSYFFRYDIAALAKMNPGTTAMMRYQARRANEQGRTLRLRQEWVPIKRISPYLRRAVIIAEDARFWSHEGFDLDAMKEAFEKDIKAKRFKYGGSTITQQLAKNLYFEPSKNPLRKLREAVVAWRIERNLPKSRIIEIYLNVAEWGEGIYGAEAAAQHYYSKSARELEPEEAARLAAALPNPKRFNPSVNSRYAKKRAAVILRFMIR